MSFRYKTELFDEKAVLRLDDFFVWCGSMARSKDGLCHLFFSLWPRGRGFEAWVTDSKIAYAQSKDPGGPYEFKSISLPGSGISGAWDRDVTHNPTVLYKNGLYYLYYTGNYGNGEWWTHRNHQRIGLAISENPEGPWKRSAKPLIDVENDGGLDAVMCSNPTVTEMPDGRYIMIYKAVADKNPAPFYGPVHHRVAFSDSPEGPFLRHPEPVFNVSGAGFPAEDPFVFTYSRRLYCLLKDNGKFYSENERSIVIFESENGIDWKVSDNPVFVSREIETESGNLRKFFRLERPQIFFEGGKPEYFFCAVKPDENIDESMNIHMKIGEMP